MKLSLKKLFSYQIIEAPCKKSIIGWLHCLELKKRQFVKLVESTLGLKQLSS
jgi:hypothetical protein